MGGEGVLHEGKRTLRDPSLRTQSPQDEHEAREKSPGPAVRQKWEKPFPRIAMEDRKLRPTCVDVLRGGSEAGRELSDGKRRN